jgi:hypothetical protein
MMGLKGIFEEICSSGVKDKKSIQQEILERVKIQNYIPSSSEQEYLNALWREYRRFLGEEVEEEGASGLVIRVLGPGCYACEKMTEDIKEILVELDIAADFMHIKDAKEIGKYGMVGTPGLVINKKVKCSGRGAPKKKLRQWIQEAAGI